MNIVTGENEITIFAIFGLSILLLILFSGCSSIQNEYIENVSDEFKKQPIIPETVLVESDIAHLPGPVKKYITYSGSLGNSKPQNVRIEFDAQMIKKPGDAPMEASSEQVNFFENYSRFFFMKASKFFVPMRVLHVYADHKATFVVRVASLFNAVDLSGEQLTTAETVTILNDLCVFAPGALIDKRISWKEIDSLSSEATFTNGAYKVTAILYFNEKGELINFISNDRSALQDDGSLKKLPWITPLGDYKNFNGRKVATTGATIYRYPEGDFIYGRFTLKNITYNVNALQ